MVKKRGKNSEESKEKWKTGIKDRRERGRRGREMVKRMKQVWKRRRVNFRKSGSLRREEREEEGKGEENEEGVKGDGEKGGRGT